MPLLGGMFAAAAMEHREHDRLRVCFPLDIDAPGKHNRFGVTRNVSASGMLFGTRSRFALGQRLRITFRVSSTAPEYSVRGRVVRLGRDGRLRGAVYPRRVALQFEHPQPALTAEFRDAAKCQAELYSE